MATRKIKSDSPPPAPKMVRRVVHNETVYEPGDPCPVSGETLARWKRHGWVD